MKRIAVSAPLLVAAFVLAACATPAPVGDTETGQWLAPEPPDEFASGLMIGSVPDGFAFEWNEGHETAILHTFTSANGAQISIGRQLSPPPYPIAGEEVIRNGREFTVIADEVRILEQLDDGVRVEVVSASLDVDSLLLIAESVSYDPSRDSQR
jgi:hypothetical protein